MLRVVWVWIGARRLAEPDLAKVGYASDSFERAWARGFPDGGRLIKLFCLGTFLTLICAILSDLARMPNYY